ncbi:transglutaminase-like domain-containing protein [Pleomorphovibrio marinus]|uniref:transglutaminase-like domain-containing protein n=1 Tax=Pleomorphovibrio marinus TaxID=2164132 RepID=UPI0018E56829|nr:transglutaminase-like domain-containing protein [Pleomorphovibrio marinus]
MKLFLSLLASMVYCPLLLASGPIGVLPETYSILEENIKVTLEEDFGYVEEVDQSLLLLSSSALDHAQFECLINSFTKLLDFEAKIINPLSGKTLQTIKRKQLKEKNLVSDGTLYGDNKLLFFLPTPQQYPIKIEYRWKRHVSGNFHLPRWHPYHYFNQLIKKATFEIAYPEEIGLRYKSNVSLLPPTEIQKEGKVSLFWELSDLPSLTESADDLPEVATAPVHFSMQGYRGNMQTWEDFGKWMHLLNHGKGDLSEGSKALVHTLVDSLMDPYEKIDRLYKYLQKNYRYVSIQLGLGGWMPENANSVVQSKFGDCKGLTMLLKAMLQEAGIPSDYTLVRSGSEAKPIDLDFPSNQFNHAILRVPLEEETIWIECTSTTLPAGFLGKSTMDRHVLVVTENGGVIDRTPSYSQSNYHRINHNLHLELLPQGNAHLHGTKVIEGFPASTFTHLHKNTSEKEFTTFLNSHTGGGLVIQEFSMATENEGKVPLVNLKYQGDVQRFYQSTSKRVLIPLSWTTWDLEEITTGAGELKEMLIIQLNQDLEWDISPPQLSYSCEYYSLDILADLKDDRLTIEKKLDIHFPEDITADKRNSVFREIKKALNQQLSFIKN